MQLHQLKPNHKKARKRVGRGGKRGTYAGRGVKGQKARAGRKPRPTFGGGDTTFAKRLPKQRGSVGPVKVKRGSKKPIYRQQPETIDIKKIQEKFKTGEVVSPKTLRAKGLSVKRAGIKILGVPDKKARLPKFRGVRLSKRLQAKPASPKKGI